MSNQAAWGNHAFTVYSPSVTTWNNVPGIYIFSGISRQNRWVPLYIGQTDSFRTRIPSHERWNEAVRLGATHIHAAVVESASIRDAFEAVLIRTYEPMMNTQHMPA